MLWPPSHRCGRFGGSLTTTPCSDGAGWLALKQPVSISCVRVEKLAGVPGDPDDWPIQPLDARTAIQFVPKLAALDHRKKGAVT